MCQDFISDECITQGDVVNEYCKLGCASSVCGALTTLQKSGKISSPSTLYFLIIDFVGISRHENNPF